VAPLESAQKLPAELVEERRADRAVIAEDVENGSAWTKLKDNINEGFGLKIVVDSDHIGMTELLEGINLGLKRGGRGVSIWTKINDFDSKGFAVAAVFDLENMRITARADGSNDVETLAVEKNTSFAEELVRDSLAGCHEWRRLDFELREKTERYESQNSH
jgi:hypothetical protein